VRCGLPRLDFVKARNDELCVNLPKIIKIHSPNPRSKGIL
jgi:hypothetical protein